MPGDAERLDQVHRIIDDVMARRDCGEYVTDSQIIDSNRELMPELAEELAVLREIQLAALAARKAGPASSAAQVLAEPIDRPHMDADGADLPPPVIAGYSLVHEISRGGQAAVFKAVQECTRRKVAVKVLLGGTWADSRSRRRFKQETEILGRLSHRHIVSVLDAGRTEDGSFYLVMPFVDGCCLEDYLALHPGNQPEAVRHKLDLFIKIADAVAEAHRHGIVHRDLKPSNILVDGKSEPYVMDFGLALALPPQGHERDQLTLTGQMVGSVPWFSPEQANGLRLDERSDVYALGVMLYRCFTGDFPYPVFAAARNVLNHIVATVPPPITAGLAEYPQAQHLDAIIQKSLAKSPERRFASMAELANELRELVAAGARAPGATPLALTAPELARRSSQRRQVRKQLRRVGLILAAPATLGLCITAWSHRRFPQSRTQDMQPAGLSSVAMPTVATPPVVPSFTNSLGIRFLQLPAATFLMGSGPREPEHRDSETQHSVTLPHAFWISTMPITVGQYRMIMGNAPGHPDAHDDDNPMTDLTWVEAADFCRELSRREHSVYRLPTEAEWEDAARVSSRLRPCPDMSPGVREWCSDWYGPYPQQPVTDPQGVAKSFQKVVRGGPPDGTGKRFGPARRNAVAPTLSRPDVGFRVVMEADRKILPL